MTPMHVTIEYFLTIEFPYVARTMRKSGQAVPAPLSLSILSLYVLSMYVHMHAYLAQADWRNPPLPHTIPGPPG